MQAAAYLKCSCSHFQSGSRFKHTHLQFSQHVTSVTVNQSISSRQITVGGSLNYVSQYNRVQRWRWINHNTLVKLWPWFDCALSKFDLRILGPAAWQYFRQSSNDSFHPITWPLCDPTKGLQLHGIRPGMFLPNDAIPSHATVQSIYLWRTRSILYKIGFYHREVWRR